MKAGLFLAVCLLAGCEALTIAGTTRPSDNVAVSVGTTITPDGVSRPSGTMKVGLF